MLTGNSGALDTKGSYNRRVAVKAHDFVPAANQATSDVGAHSAKTNYSDLHCTRLLNKIIGLLTLRLCFSCC